MLRHLADGGMAQLLLARSTGLEGFERHVVIKRIHAEQARNKQHVDMFLDEARLAASLHHHNIVQVHDVGQENGEYFFAMEYVHGEDLRKILTHLAAQKLQLPIEHIVTIISAAASGLHYAHEMKGAGGKPLGIVHRDVSPANILVGYDGNVKVVDFGIAKAIARSADTQAGTLKGKAAYMAPEQCTGVPIDRRSDVFALGIVLWELLTVRRLFKGTSDFVTMTAIVSGKVPRPSEHRKDLPKPLEAIVLKALAANPQERFQSCEELRLALEDFADAAGLRTSTTAVGDYMITQFGRRTEPWLLESDDPVIEIVDPDFDGSASTGEPVDIAAAAIPQSVFDIQSSPIMKARARARTTGQPVFPTPVAGTPKVKTGNDSAGWGKPGDVPETGSGTPMAWTPSERLRAVSPPSSRRKRWLIAGAIGAPLVIVAVLILSRGHGAGDTAAHAATPAAAEAPAAAPVAPPPEPAPVAQPEPPPPAPVAAPEPAKPEVAKPIKKRTQAKPKPAPAWDRNSLFPK